MNLSVFLLVIVVANAAATYFTQSLPMNLSVFLLIIVVANAAAIITYLIMQPRLLRLREELKTVEALRQAEASAHEKSLALLQENFAQQLQAVRSQMSAETEKLLQQREEALNRKAEETFRTLAGPLGKDLKAMQESFDAQKRSQAEGQATLRTVVEQAVKQLREQTSDIGSKADNLARALKGQNKMTGSWGETILYNILVAEGMEEGRDFDREESLRDAEGHLQRHADSGKRLRPDYILHYPDKTEVIVDAKTSLDALSDWYAAEDEAARADAAARNLQAIRQQIRSLAEKRYQDYIREGYRSLDYVLMFIPNYGALQLAKTLAPNIFQEAYRQGVLLATEETLMPFLRMIRIGWFHYDQARNQEKIIKAAQTMVDRVHDFAKAHAAMGDRLRDALEEYERAAAKISEGGSSILTSARQVLKLGVPQNPKKALPEE